MPAKRNKPYENRTIVLPFKQRGYASLIANPKRFRTHINKLFAENPRLFPAEIEQGFLMKDSYHSKPMSLTIRRIEISGVAYTIRPSFVLPRLVGWTKNAQSALLLRKYSVPFWVLALISCAELVEALVITSCIGGDLKKALAATALLKRRFNIQTIYRRT